MRAKSGTRCPTCGPIRATSSGSAGASVPITKARSNTRNTPRILSESTLVVGATPSGSRGGGAPRQVINGRGGGAPRQVINGRGGGAPRQVINGRGGRAPRQVINGRGVGPTTSNKW